MLVLFKTFQQYILIFSSLFKGRRSLAYNLFFVYNNAIVVNKPHIIKNPQRSLHKISSIHAQIYVVRLSAKLFIFYL